MTEAPAAGSGMLRLKAVRLGVIVLFLVVGKYMCGLRFCVKRGHRQAWPRMHG